MSSPNIEDVKEQQEQGDDIDNIKNRVDGDDPSVEDRKDSDKNEENTMPSPEQEEECIKKKYGGMLPKKKPLISKDHERAFFDSADWALGKQGAQKPKGPLEALRPKLQPTPHQQVRSRRSAYAPAEDCDGDGGTDQASFKDENDILDGGNDKNIATEDQTFLG